MTTFSSFPIFSAKHKEINKRKTYGCYYLSAFAHAHFDQLIQQYEDCAYLSIGVPLRSKKTMQADLLEAEECAQIMGNLAPLKQVVQSAQQQTAAAQAFTCYQTWNQTLLKADYWQSLKGALKNIFQDPALDEQQEKARQAFIQQKKHQLDALQRSWQRHGKFSHYSAAALVYAANRLENIAYFLEKAQAELDERTEALPEFVLADYATFLQQSRQTVQAEKTALAAAMNARLQLIRKTADLNNEDVTFHLLTQLKDAKVVKTETLQSFKKRTIVFDSHIFMHMHRYVAQQGGIAKLRHTFHVQVDDKTVPLVGKYDDTQTLLVPEHLSHYVPEKPHTLGFLRKGQQFRYTFFQDKTALLLQLALLPDLKIKANCYRAPAEDTLWQRLKTIENDIDQALQASEKQTVKGWKTPFYQTSNQLLAEWQHLLREHKHKVLQQQLLFLEQWASVPPVKHAYYQPHFSQKDSVEITAILEQLESTILASSGEQSPLHEHWSNVKNALDTLLAKDHYYAQGPSVAADTLEQLAVGIPVNQEALCQTLDYCSGLSPEALQTFKQNHRSELNTIVCWLEHYFSTPLKQLLKAEDATSQIALAQQCGQLIGQLNSPSLAEKLTRFLETAITQYAQWVEENDQILHEQNPDYLKAYQALLEKLANPAQVAQLATLELKQRSLAIDTPVMTYFSQPQEENTRLQSEKKESPEAFLVRQQQCLMKQREQNENILQQQRRLEAEMEISIAHTQKSLHLCETRQQACQKALLDRPTDLPNGDNAPTAGTLIPVRLAPKP